MDYIDVVTTLLYPKIDDDDMYMTLPVELPEGRNT